MISLDLGDATSRTTLTKVVKHGCVWSLSETICCQYERAAIFRQSCTDPHVCHIAVPVYINVNTTYCDHYCLIESKLIESMYYRPTYSHLTNISADESWRMSSEIFSLKNFLLVSNMLMRVSCYSNL